MPASLRAHIRYPEDFFAIQARKYATYHMLDPQVFYNREDLWAVPRRTVATSATGRKKYEIAAITTTNGARIQSKLLVEGNFKSRNYCTFRELSSENCR